MYEFTYLWPEFRKTGMVFSQLWEDWTVTRRQSPRVDGN